MKFSASILLCLVVIYMFNTEVMRANAGCGLNFDKMRHRRLEAIRGQILSKLGFNKLPKNEELPPPRREEVRMYNITRDFVEEQERRKHAECGRTTDDDWYAQDIHTVYKYDRQRPGEFFLKLVYFYA